MSNGGDQSLVFHDSAHPVDKPGTHVLILGVGKYQYGKDLGASPVGGELSQLTSPPISARAIANWFIRSFKNPKKPLVSVSLLISEQQAQGYTSPRPSGAPVFTPPEATLTNVKNAAQAWANRLNSHKDNLAVFYFCGHGASLGDQAALLLDDFGEPGSDYDGAIDLNVLLGTMKNSPAIEQLYLLDCCRTNADDLYQNETAIGSRVVSIVSFQRGHSTPSHQFALFPTIDGEEAFGVINDISAFCGSLIDAMSFAAADCSTGVWRTTTGTILSAVDQLIRYRVPESLTKRSKPEVLNGTSFDFNEIDEPTITRSYVTISDKNLWGQVELECADPSGIEASQKKHSKNAKKECCDFYLKEGRWQFSGSLPVSPPTIQDHECTIRMPVAHITLKVMP